MITKSFILISLLLISAQQKQVKRSATLIAYNSPALKGLEGQHVQILLPKAWKFDHKRSKSVSAGDLCQVWAVLNHSRSSEWLKISLTVAPKIKGQPFIGDFQGEYLMSTVDGVQGLVSEFVGDQQSVETDFVIRDYAPARKHYWFFYVSIVSNDLSNAKRHNVTRYIFKHLRFVK